MKRAKTKNEWMNIDEVIEFTVISKSTIYRMMEAKKFPRPVKFLNVNRWKKEEVERALHKLMCG